MGWTTYHNKPSDPKATLDGLYTFENEHCTSRVLKSALKSFTEYYAAVERTDKKTGAVEVFAGVCKVTLNPFGYKDMSEEMGPCERNCPAAILDLLTPTDHEYALQWRWDCRANLARKTDNKIVEGATVRFNAKWGDGHDTFVARKAGGGRKGWRFAPVGQSYGYKLSGWRNYIAEVIPPGGVSTASALEALGPRPKTQQELWDEAHADQFVSGAAWGSWAAWVPEGKVGVVFRRRSDGAELWARVDQERYDKRLENAQPRVHGVIILDPAIDQVIAGPPANLHATKEVRAA